MPSEFDGFGNAGELDRLDQPGGTYQCEDLPLRCFERIRVFGAKLHKEGGGFGVKGFPIRRSVRKRLTRNRESRSDHKLDSGRTEADETRNKRDGFVDGRDWNPCPTRHAWRRNRLEHRFSDER